MNFLFLFSGVKFYTEYISVSAIFISLETSKKFPWNSTFFKTLLNSMYSQFIWRPLAIWVLEDLQYLNMSTVKQ